jgi:predicted nucleic acid-binding protein
MANEVFFDTSGFFTVMDERDDLHQKPVGWLHSRRGEVRPVTTEWVVGEPCTLLVARKRPTSWRCFWTISTAARRCC